MKSLSRDSPFVAENSSYVYVESKQQKARLAKLGRHSMGKSCLYFRRLADIDKSVLRQIVSGSITEFTRRYGPPPHAGGV